MAHDRRRSGYPNPMPGRVPLFLLVLTLGGCGDAGPGAPVIDESTLALRMSEHVPNAGWVTFETAEPVRGYLEYGPDESYGHTTPIPEEPATFHDISLVGLPPSSTWHYRVVARTEDGDVASSDHLVETGRCVGDIPDVELLADDGEAWGAYTLAAFGWPGPPDLGGTLILDDAGEVVWCWADGTLRFVPWASRSQDGQHAVILTSNDAGDFSSSVHYVSLDGRSAEEILVPRAHHSIAQVGVAGVRFAYLASVVREWEGDLVLGDRIVEVMDDGTEREVWNAFDALPVETHGGWENRNTEGAADWTHANGLHYAPETDAYYVSTYFLSSIYAIDRTTGALLWTLGGDHSDFTFVDDYGFRYQHAPELHGDTLYVFDNGGPEGARGVAYELDTEQWTATRVWEWTSPEGSRVGVLGDVDLLDDGQLLTGWGDLGQVAVTGADGTLHWRVDAEPGAILGRAERLASLLP